MNQTTDTETISNLLIRAVDSLRLHGEAPYFSTSFDTLNDLADCIEKRRKEIDQGTLTENGRRELWSIFAPTSEWDDAGGDSSLGNQIFEHLNQSTTN